MRQFQFTPIGFIRSSYSDPQQVPKGLGVEHRAEGVLEVLPEYEPGLQDVEGFSHLFLIWVFHQSDGYELVATPPSDNKEHGVFATRSPHRPNPIGLSVVELVKREGCRLHLRGVDMVDGTPVLDIKPYLSSVTSDKLKRGWLAEAEKRASGKQR